MSEVEIIIIRRVRIREGDYDFAQRSLGLFNLESIPRMGETVFYENEELNTGTFYVKHIFHHIEPESPVQILVISPDDEDYYDGKK
jgi:hypothetical protein